MGRGDAVRDRRARRRVRHRAAVQAVARDGRHGDREDAVAAAPLVDRRPPRASADARRARRRVDVVADEDGHERVLGVAEPRAVDRADDGAPVDPPWQQRVVGVRLRALRTRGLGRALRVGARVPVRRVGDGGPRPVRRPPPRRQDGARPPRLHPPRRRPDGDLRQVGARGRSTRPTRRATSRTRPTARWPPCYTAVVSGRATAGADRASRAVRRRGAGERPRADDLRHVGVAAGGRQPARRTPSSRSCAASTSTSSRGWRSCSCPRGGNAIPQGVCAAGFLAFLLDDDGAPSGTSGCCSPTCATRPGRRT